MPNIKDTKNQSEKMIGNQNARKHPISLKGKINDVLWRYFDISIKEQRFAKQRLQKELETVIFNDNE